MWLHVDQRNEPAVAMYKQAGYKVVDRDRAWRPPFQKRYLMCKTLQPRRRKTTAEMQQDFSGDNVALVDGQWVVHSRQTLAHADASAGQGVSLQGRV